MRKQIKNKKREYFYLFSSIFNLEIKFLYPIIELVQSDLIFSVEDTCFASDIILIFLGQWPLAISLRQDKI